MDFCHKITWNPGCALADTATEMLNHVHTPFLGYFSPDLFKKFLKHPILKKIGHTYLIYSLVH